ncbi:MAG: FAD-dependent oxidoreductase [Vicinamibacterales bacterium]|nr:FAD-dependent oxidoreductase [Vicinamibacterales bacterium]
MRVLIVGAGVAGLTAARRLAAAGHAPLLLDKGRAPGGRVSTRRILSASDLLQFDHGAQYFTARDPGFAAAVSAWSDAGVVRPWAGRFASFDSEGREAVNDAVTRWVGVPGMSAIGRHLAGGLDVRTGARVTRLAREDAGWTATLEDGATMDGFDRVIVAVPAPQAVPLLDAAPALAAGAARVPMHPCWAVLVAFDAPVPVRFDAAFVLHSPLGWVAHDGMKPKRGRADTWVLHASASWSTAHRDDPADAVGPFLLNAFADLVPGTLPLPIHLSVHRWRYAAAELPAVTGPLVDRTLGLAVCGDWCLGNRIEAAYLSGARAAEAVTG